jgi:hypothetical protein
MMNNERYKEAREGTANLESVEVSVFVSFCEFAYAGNYREHIKRYNPDSEAYVKAIAEKGKPLKEIKLGEEAEPGEAEVGFEGIAPQNDDLFYAEDVWSETEPTRKRTMKEEFAAMYQRQHTTITKAEQLWKDFKALSFEQKRSINKQSANTIGGDGSIAPTMLLLQHAKIYVFAQEYLIYKLCALSLSRLHGHLKVHELTELTIGDIVEVLEFAYTHTAKRESSETDLRKLIVHFVACNADIFKRDPNFRSLLEENGEMACDLFFRK